MRTLLSGLALGESPRWHDGRLWLANWGTGDVIAVDLDGRSEVVAHVPVTIPYSIDWLPDGRLLVVAKTRVLRLEPDGSLVTHADLAEIDPNHYNEIVVDGRGNAYVNGGGFDLMAGEPFAPGYVVLVRPDGTATQVADGIAFGNGMAVTPDNSTLIVAESYGQRLTAFDIGPDGGLSNRRVWAALGDDPPDGICIDAEGAVWYATVPGKRCVRVREGGEVLASVEADRGCFACMLGGPDGTTLFVLAAEWRGIEGLDLGERTGQVLVAEAPAPAAGYP
ncbi:MAG TPA: SMP-30/gluconolactonase/LRE family protein [Jatrophihabitantaceae bacterium]|jgi:sugar lactone lactonase YvrE